MGLMALSKRNKSNNSEVNTKENRFSRITGLQGKLIIPYMLLTIVLAMGGVYIVTQLVTSSIRERFVNQLFEASRVAAEGIIRHEEMHLENLRTMVYTNGVAEAVENGDADLLYELVSPHILNENIQILTIVNAEGYEVLSVEHLTEDQFSRDAGTNLNAVDIVSKTLSGQNDTFGDKFTDILPGTQGPTLYTSAPIKDQSGNITGTMLIGTPLNLLLKDIRNQALADIILLGPEEGVIATTLVQPEDNFAEIQSLITSTQDLGRTYDITLYEREFQIIFSTLTIRDQMTGLLGVILPSSYVVATEATSRNTLALLFTLGTLAVIIIGYILSQNIAKPILSLRKLSQSVASGNFEQTAGFQRKDEIGDLAQAFDTMTQHLKERTEEAERLYAEALQRNKELAEINEKLKNTQAQLVQSEKLASVGQLTAGIVHDVKNPLAVIMGMTEFMLSEEDLSPELRHEVQTMNNSAVKGNQIVSDLLTFARQSTPDLIERDMRDTLEAALRLTGYLIKKGRVQVVRNLPDQPVYMSYDAQQIEQVLINLIANAIQAMPNGGELRIGLERQNGDAIMQVSDSGSGIAPEHLTRIFDPFFTTKPEGEGTGLGLSVSHGIIACHHGDIQVESEIGEGTTFTIKLPIVHHEENQGVEQ